ncbi:hypothetical protein ACT3CD_11360 [Geofilum sp. OHC36d9]|uniref:hypothetical protein n=1 Tax=Geofilum sp. OHC36d9 TaxID=3458413 RepID=UPI00403490DC
MFRILKISVPMLLWGLNCAFSAYSQNTEATVDSLAQTAESKHAFYVSLGTGSNMLYMGSTLNEQSSYLSAQGIYSYNKELMVAASVYHLPGVNPSIAFYDMSVGYSKIINKTFDGSLYLSGYFTADELQATYFSNFWYLTLSGGIDWNILYSQLVYSKILDNEGYYLQLINSHYFATNDFLKGNAFIDFNPAANLVMGNQYSVETASSNTGSGTGNGETEPVYSSSFGLLDIEISIATGFNIKNFTFEVEPLYYIPLYDNPDYSSSPEMALFINAYWKIGR